MYGVPYINSWSSESVLPTTPSGESGIRTHAPLRTNGFQDRLVMTTSISLRMCVVCVSPDDKSYSNKKGCYCQHIFTQFLIYIFQVRKSPILSAFAAFSFSARIQFFLRIVSISTKLLQLFIQICHTLFFFPRKIKLPVCHMIFYIRNQDHLSVPLRISDFSLPLIKSRTT